MYRVHRRLRRWTLGTYPTLSLADARDQARVGLREVALGRDPALAKREARAAETVDDLVTLYITKYAQPRKRSWKEDRRLLTKHVLPAWRHRAVGDIRRRDVREVIGMVAAAGAPTTANRLRAVLHKMFAFAIDEELVETNPVTSVPRPAPERRRDRVLTDDELRQLWQNLEAEPPAIAAVFRLRLLTAQRGGEVLELRWGDLDPAGAWWTIPGAASKNGIGTSCAAHRTCTEDSPGPPGECLGAGGLRSGWGAGKASAVRGNRSIGDFRFSRTRPSTDRRVIYGVRRGTAAGHREDPEPRRTRCHRRVRPTQL